MKYILKINSITQKKRKKKMQQKNQNGVIDLIMNFHLQ